MNAVEWTNTGGARLWSCGKCGMMWGAEAQADACCRCRRTDCGEPREGHSTWCPEHRAEHYRRTNAERDARELAVPLVDPADVPGMVCHDTYWYSDLDSCLDDLADTNPDRDWATTVVWPGVCGKAETPLIAEYVREAWSEQYEEPDDHVTSTVEQVLAGVQEWLEEHAPECWTANTRVRIDMAKAWAEYDTRQSTLGWSA